MKRDVHSLRENSDLRGGKVEFYSWGQILGLRFRLHTYVIKYKEFFKINRILLWIKEYQR